MTKAGQRALLILAATLVVLAGLYVVLARQQTETAARSACITEYRSKWERAVGDIVITAAKGNNPSRTEVRRLRAVQRDLGHLDDLCPIDPWWRL